MEQILKLHRQWIENEVEGVRADLRGANLRGANLRGANLRGADLRGADLRGAYLRDADLQDADLQGSYLQDANLQGAYLQDADLQDANLQDANLRGANLRGAYLQDADLQDADLRGATGNNGEVKSLQLGKYYITILVGVKIHIGCKNYTVEQWKNFTDYEISRMDNGAIEWWKEWKEVILRVAG